MSPQEDMPNPLEWTERPLQSADTCPLRRHGRADAEPFTWCARCQQANATYRWRLEGWRCPTSGCNGSMEHQRPWSVVALLYGYPQVPQEGVPYLEPTMQQR